MSSWSWFKEPVGISSSSTTQSSGLVEQIQTTAHKTDFLWYSLRYSLKTLMQIYIHIYIFCFLTFMIVLASMNLNADDPLLQGGSQQVLHVDSNGHAIHVFINGNLTGDTTKCFTVTTLFCLKMLNKLLTDCCVGSAQGKISNRVYTADIPVTFKQGQNTIDLLSMTVGLQVQTDS